MKDKFERFDFMGFLILFIVVAVTSYVLAINSKDEAVFVGFYAFSIGAFVMCVSIYSFPMLKNLVSPSRKIAPLPDTVLLRGIDGSRPMAKPRTLDDMLIKNEI